MNNSGIVLQVAIKAVVVNRSGQVLVLREAIGNAGRSKPGHYQLPGGRVEPGENFLDALRREVLEETGITQLEIGTPLTVGEWRPVVRGVQYQIVGMFLACTSAEDKITLSDEHDGYKWLSKADYLEADIMVPDNDAVKQFFAGTT